jgi:protein-disulfide isomerase/uncharacterized membrane protein
MPFFSHSFEKPVRVTLQLLHLLKVPVTADTVNEFILSHPDHPSLLCISDALHQWHIGNAALRIEKEKIHELPTPFIAHAGGEFMIITRVTNEEVFYLDDDDRMRRETLPDFQNKWRGVVLIAEPEENAGEKEYAIKHKKEFIRLLSWPTLSAALILMAITGSWIFAVNNTTADSIGYVLLNCCKLAGLAVSGLLLWYEIDRYNPLLQKICTSGGGSKANCNAVLSSPQAKPFSFISWSELGFFYFAGGFLLLTLQPHTGIVYTIALLNLPALPYVVFSVFYQWRVVKQWCPLCLFVQAILVAEFIISLTAGFISSNNLSVALSLGNLALLFIHFIIPVLGWYFIKPHLLGEKEGKNKKYELARLKSNQDIFTAMLLRQKPVTRSTDGLGIVLGNPNAAHTMLKVCNPYCGPCAKAHSEIDELLHDNDNLKVQIIFTATPDKADIKYFPVRHLMAIAGKNDEGLTMKALDDWYLPEKKDYNVFAAKYPMNGELESQEEKLASMSEWCNETGIAFTPTFFFDGHQLPAMYTITDLKTILTGD